MNNNDTIISPDRSYITPTVIKDGTSLKIIYNYLGLQTIEIKDFDFTQTKDNPINTFIIGGQNYKINEILNVLFEYTINDDTVHNTSIFNEVITIDKNCPVAQIQNYKSTDRIIIDYQEDAQTSYSYDERNRKLIVNYGTQTLYIKDDDDKWTNQVPIYIRSESGLVPDDITEKTLTISNIPVNPASLSWSDFSAKKLEGLNLYNRKRK